jgi:DNA-binding NarL/FixJ family response regulator
VRLVQAGGTFVPPCALEHDWSRRDGVTKAGELLTERQMKVAEALCQGMANKQIAYALQMSEHTVKIHLRHIMRKLNARNRTEVAILANAIFNGWTLRSAAP